MEIKRFYVDVNDIVGDKVVISGDESIHLTSVLRHKVGYKIIVCNNMDNIDYHCTITAIDKMSVTARIDSREHNISSLNKNIILAMALPKGDKADFVLQKAVELGASKVYFIASEYVNESKFNLARLVKIAREAAKQCGSAIYPEVVGLIDYKEYLTQYCTSGLTLLMYEKEQNNTLESVRVQLKQASSVNVIVGSEGGFSSSEYELAVKHGAISMSLGSRIMRCETAAVAALTLVSYISGASCKKVLCE